jgi:hypothetical protein
MSRITIPIPLDDGSTGYLDVPFAITTSDAERIANLAASLPFDQPEPCIDGSTP